MLPPDDPRIAIDLEISVLEKQIVDLKRRRNTFALTSRLPPEVISRVFVAGLSFDIHDVSPHDIDGRKKATVSAADYLTPCHVCHSWRAIALRSPDMWSLLRLSSGASASLVDFMWNNSKSLPVSLSVWDESQAAAKDATAIASLLQSGLHRLHALSIYMERHSMKALLDSVMGRAGEMQSLTIVGQLGGSTLPVPGNPRIFSNGTPKLRRLHLQNYVLPWATPIFASPHPS
ncbi:hypothetical protein NMY22_g18406 [Coprinellus aureogranulatus]|nr:hypothetical protein NMY22_g18406 [Coprinellus aureogranulatus]